MGLGMPRKKLWAYKYKWGQKKKAWMGIWHLQPCAHGYEVLLPTLILP